MSTNGSTLPKKCNTESEKNPFYERPERSAYELCRLLQALPEHGHQVDRGNQAQMQQIEAARLHAVTATGTLLCGLEALGSLMFTAGVNDRSEVSSTAIADLGYLIKHVAVELQFLTELRGEFEVVIQGARA